VNEYIVTIFHSPHPHPPPPQVYVASKDRVADDVDFILRDALDSLRPDFKYPPPPLKESTQRNLDAIIAKSESTTPPPQIEDFC
jgi:hypothetical protein